MTAKWLVNEVFKKNVVPNIKNGNFGDINKLIYIHDGAKIYKSTKSTKNYMSKDFPIK